MTDRAGRSGSISCVTPMVSPMTVLTDRAGHSGSIRQLSLSVSPMTVLTDRAGRSAVTECVTTHCVLCWQIGLGVQLSPSVWPLTVCCVDRSDWAFRQMMTTSVFPSSPGARVPTRSWSLVSIMFSSLIQQIDLWPMHLSQNMYLSVYDKLGQI